MLIDVLWTPWRTLRWRLSKIFADPALRPLIGDAAEPTVRLICDHLTDHSQPPPGSANGQ